MADTTGQCTSSGTAAKPGSCSTIVIIVVIIGEQRIRHCIGWVLVIGDVQQSICFSQQRGRQDSGSGCWSRGGVSYCCPWWPQQEQGSSSHPCPRGAAGGNSSSPC